LDAVQHRSAVGRERGRHGNGGRKRGVSGRARVLQVGEGCGGVANEVGADIPGAKAVYDELKTRFPGGKRKSGETETVTETIKKKVSVS
jgi:hypothetical protein